MSTISLALREKENVYFSEAGAAYDNCLASRATLKAVQIELARSTIFRNEAKDPFARLVRACERDPIDGYLLHWVILTPRVRQVKQ